MNKFTAFVFAGLAALSALVPVAVAGDAPPVNPVNQPLVVLRAVNGDAIQSVLDTRQAKALELDKKDYSGPIPGVEANIESLRAFLAGLAYGKAENIWYCLSQQGSSLANQTGAMGWDAVDSQPDAPLPQVAGWLKDLGLDVTRQDLETRPIDRNHARIVISKDADARQDILGGQGGPDGGWRGNLAQFVADENGGLGVWANTRPLLGLLTILTGIDFRAKMNAHNMGVPVSAQINLYNNKGDLGFDAKFNNLLPDEWVKTETAPLLIQTRPDPIIDINFPAPAGLWDALDIDKEVLFLANIDVLPLIPRSLNLTAWRDDSGSMHWSLIGLMGNKDKFNEQLRRIHGWLELISAVSSDAFKLSTVKSNWGDELWHVRLGQDSFVLGVVDVEAAGKDNAFLVISCSEKDWPNPFELKVTPAATDTLVHWRVNLDQESKRELVRNLADMSQERGARDFDVPFFERFLPDTDTGWVSMEGKSLRAISTHGLMPLLVPGILEAVKKGVQPEDAGMRKVAQRLRFLLDLASQSRFRELNDHASVPTRLPGDLAELLFSDPAGREWLDREFGRFPGAFQSVSQILGVIAGGDAVDGFHYSIDAVSDGWNVNAVSDAGEQMRIDAEGNLSVKQNGVWVGHTESLLDMISYFQ